MKNKWENVPNTDTLTTDQLLELMEVYLDEWTHRDAMLWKQTFTYFSAVLVVTILPFSDIGNLNLQQYLPPWIFPAIGIVLSIFFLIIGRGYATRLTAIGKSYARLIEKLPEDYRRIRLSEISKSPISNRPMADFIVYTMFTLLLILCSVILVLSI